ncbi:MAG: thiamine pyrophosphate-binding protein [Candidatus Omnitrophica bacterium]|nr:thiamine pyrophosphate-binding protein [Candidatus Omnitrophota bacterium]
MVKLSDYLVQFLARQGIKDVFMVSGGGIIHLTDSLGRNKNIKYICNYNEQATSYSAEGYARFRNRISACLVTTGPGSTNALSGVASAWMDSVPMLVISGQVKRELIADYQKLRQIGEQEVNIIDMVRPITKYAATTTNPKRIRYELERCFYEATSGRPGPVWLNIPLDVQGSLIDPRSLPSFLPEKSGGKSSSGLKNKVKRTISLLKQSKRPVLFCGYGIRLAGAGNLLEQLLDKVKIPVLLSFNGMDLLSEDHPSLVGKPGIVGQRRANFAVQNSDYFLSIGSRLNIKIVGYDYKNFAARAKKIIVDIDSQELKKSTVCPDLAVTADAGDFLKEFIRQAVKAGIRIDQKWLAACRQWKGRYPSISKDFLDNKKHVNTYVFYDRLSDVVKSQDVIISGNALSALCLYQAFKVKKGQRVFTNNGYGAMGWDLPAAIGACIANNRRPTICVTGDGSIQMNIQELQLVKHHRLPLKIFIFNNAGYTSIRLTQDNFFNGFYVGADKASGVSNPDFKKIAESYGLNYEKILTNRQLKSKIAKVISRPGPVFCEVNVSPRQGLNPKTVSQRNPDGSFQSRPLEDMFPFLSREELEKNMQISKT